MPEFLNPIKNNSTESRENGSSKENSGQKNIKSGGQTASPMAPHDGEIIEYKPSRTVNPKNKRQGYKPKQTPLETKQDKPYKAYTTTHQYNNKKPDQFQAKNIIRSFFRSIKILFSYLFLPAHPKQKSRDWHGRRKRYNKNYRNRRSRGGSRRQRGNNNNDPRDRQVNQDIEPNQSSNKNRRGSRYKGNRNPERGGKSNVGEGKARNLNQSRNRNRIKSQSGHSKPQNNREHKPQR